MSTYSGLVSQVAKLLRRQDVSEAIAVCEKKLAEMPDGPFHIAIGNSWTDLVDSLSSWITDLYAQANEEISVKALYCEMNRFDINCDRWYLDGFGYEFFGGSTGTDWLSDWMYCSGPERQFDLVGMEPLQRVFDRWDRGVLDEADETAADTATLLVTLRMIELVNNAAAIAYGHGELPQAVPVLTAAHDAEPVFTVFGTTKPKARRPKVARPVVDLSTAEDGWERVYVIESGHDDRGNSFPWDGLNFTPWWKAKTDEGMSKLVREGTALDNWVKNQIDQVTPVKRQWVPPKMIFRRRGWSCDILGATPSAYAINDCGKSALGPLLGDSVEFLPVQCDDLMDRWIIHSLVHVSMSEEAEHNGGNGRNITVIRKYAFDPDKLRGIHLFRIRLPEDTPAGNAGCCGRQLLASEQFKQTYGTAGLQGLVFKEVFRYQIEPP